MLAVRNQQWSAGQELPGDNQPFRQQVQAVQVYLLTPISQVFEQDAAIATAHFEDALPLQWENATLPQGCKHLPGALLGRKEVGEVERRVEVAPDEAARAVGVFGAEAGEVVGWGLLLVHQIVATGPLFVDAGLLGAPSDNGGYDYPRRIH